MSEKVITVRSGSVSVKIYIGKSRGNSLYDRDAVALCENARILVERSFDRGGWSGKGESF